ncbi:MAG: NAD(P)-dependent oxidoreductase [Dehalococcoidia bacterium]|nr:NAD(P)-dependent oxidoreductase [Dehalococcoidia bacterium]MSQ35315.1 NAD(P)-dependent oxidoreductase [Dehalococcoidia bacterium]
MKVLVLGGNGMMGPWTLKALEGRHELRVTDVNEAPKGFKHEYLRMSIADADAVMRAAEGMDAVVNFSVVRWDRALAFNVSTVGNYNMMAAAVEHGIRRIVNTGPFSQAAGPEYFEWDWGIGPDVPPRSGTALYLISKMLGQDICRVFAERHDVYVQSLVFCNLKDTAALKGPEGPSEYHNDLFPFVTAWPDTGTAVRAALEVEFSRLPSRCETYFVGNDLPQGKYDFSKMQRVLEWAPRYHIEAMWNKANVGA